MTYKLDLELSFAKNARNEPHITAILLNLQNLVENVSFLYFFTVAFFTTASICILNCALYCMCMVGWVVGTVTLLARKHALKSVENLFSNSSN